MWPFEYSVLKNTSDLVFGWVGSFLINEKFLLEDIFFIPNGIFSGGGSNITLSGSTVNIVAIGILDKGKCFKISFWDWFWVRASVDLITTLIVMAALVFYLF